MASSTSKQWTPAANVLDDNLVHLSDYLHIDYTWKRVKRCEPRAHYYPDALEDTREPATCLQCLGADVPSP